MLYYYLLLVIEEGVSSFTKPSKETMPSNFSWEFFLLLFTASGQLYRHNDRQW